jgi:hypothetical protein
VEGDSKAKDFKTVHFMRNIPSLALLWCAANAMGAEGIHFQSGTYQTALVELYTSEGCSSCPPAEKWMSQLKADPKLWQDFVPIAFHVDYWDYLGWRDPFGAPAYSQRQHEYAAAWRSSSVYTPGFVLNGREWSGWHGENDLRLPLGQSVGTLAANSKDGRQWLLRFEPSVQNLSGIDCHAALLGFDMTSDVKAGENRGRNLQHDFTVLTIAETPAVRSDKAFEGTVSLSVPARFHPKRLAFAAWVARHNELRPLQAVGAWVPLPNP